MCQAMASLRDQDRERERPVRRSLPPCAILAKFCFALDGHVFRREVVGDINAKAPFGQVFDMPNGRFHCISRSQVFFNSFCLGG